MTAASVTNSPLASVRLELVDSLDLAFEMKRWLSTRHENDIIGIDTESAGLSPYRDKMRMIQIGDTRTGWAVPEHFFGAAYECINEYQGDWVAHNSSYDFQVLHNNGGITLPWHRLHDTMAAGHLLDTSRSRSLKANADRLVDPRCSAGQAMLHEGMQKQGWSWASVPYNFDPYWIYSALDPVLTCLIWDKVKDAATIYREPYEIELSAIRYTAEMSVRGVLIDLPYVDRKIEQLNDYSNRASKWLKEEYSISSVNAPRQITEALKKLGVPIQFFTNTGLPQMDKAALLFYQNQEPDASAMISVIRKVRKADKMINTYFQNFRDKTTSDGRLHASIHPCAAKTSRMSISDPSLQNLPTDDELVRAAVIAEEGHTLISCDYNQLEMRLAAHFSNDQNLIDTFAKADGPGGQPFFLEVAADVFQEQITKSDKRYGLTKNVGYGYLFGAGLDKMAATAGVSVDQMRPVRQAFLDRYPGLEGMSREIIRQARENSAENGRPYVLTPTGRKLTAEPGKEYVLVNYKIQGHAAELLKMAAGKLEEVDLIDKVLLPVHDEFLFSVPEQDAQDVCKTIEQTMLFDNYKVPISAGADILGGRWIKQ